MTVTNILHFIEIFVFSFMPIIFEIVFTCISIHNANGYEDLNDSFKYYAFGNIFVFFSHL